MEASGYTCCYQALCSNRYIYAYKGLNLKIILCTICFKGWEFDAKPVFFFNIFIYKLHFDALIPSLWDSPSFGSDCWRRYNFQRCLLVCWRKSGDLVWSKGQVNSLPKRFAWGDWWSYNPLTKVSYLWGIWSYLWVISSFTW